MKITSEQFLDQLV